jgi:hypothetical protein
VRFFPKEKAATTRVTLQPRQQKGDIMANTKKPKAIKDLSPKKFEPKKAEKIKGGAKTGPGTQTEDDIYIGRSLRR